MNKSKRILFMVLSTLILIAMFSPIQADMGPKPFVEIKITNQNQQLIYATLLSKSPKSGPYSSYSESLETLPEIDQAFSEYQDSDGYYYLHTFDIIQEDGIYVWGYFPPNPFKLLLYFPETNTFQVSDINYQYAFESHFEVNLNESSTLTLNKTPQMTKHIQGFFTRLLITLIAEVGLAVLIFSRNKKVLGFIVLVNVITQLFLNLALSMTLYSDGYFSFVFAFALLELIVFIIECVLYANLKLIKQSDYQLVTIIVYTLLANILSLCLGIAL